MSKELDAWLQNVQDPTAEHKITGNTHDEMVACYMHFWALQDFSWLEIWGLEAPFHRSPGQIALGP